MLAGFQTRPIEINILPSSLTMRPSSLGMFEGPYDDTHFSHDHMLEELHAAASIQPHPGFRLPGTSRIDCGELLSDSSSEEEYSWLYDDASLLHHPHENQGTWTKILDPEELKNMDKD